MKYISLFSGIEAATVAWQTLGWEPVAYAEIEPFPKAVLKHHYPNVPDLGDMTKVNWKEYHHAAGVVVGGSPCQAFNSGRLWTILAASSCSSISELAQKLIRNGSYGRTCPEFCRLNTDWPSSRSLRPWPNSGLMGGRHGECWTLSSSVWPSGASVCSLSSTLETGGVPRRYFLSARACAGIIRRAERRGKALPRELREALETQIRTLGD